jgi:carbon-monoxide dehydrogenase small subunit
MDGDIVHSCMIPVGQVEGREIITIEGLQKTPRYKVLKESFEDAEQFNVDSVLQE